MEHLLFHGAGHGVGLVLGVAIALLLDAKDYRGKRIVTSILLLPMMATPVAVAMVWLLMFEPTAGVINFVLDELSLPEPLWIAGSATVIPSLALVDIWEWTPLITLIVLAGADGAAQRALRGGAPTAPLTGRRSGG